MLFSRKLAILVFWGGGGFAMLQFLVGKKKNSYYLRFYHTGSSDTYSKNTHPEPIATLFLA
jgi:hypothetical protein